MKKKAVTTLVALSLGAACLGLTGCGGRRKRWDDSAYTYTDSNSDTYTDTHTDPNSEHPPQPRHLHLRRVPRLLPRHLAPPR